MQASLEVSTNHTVKKKKIKSFIFLNPGEQDKIYSLNCKIRDLKHMCKHYKLRMSGNKDTLITRLHEYLNKYVPARKIQIVYKQYLLRKYIIAKGPAFIKRKLCVNETDFFTTEPVTDIFIEQFVSFKDLDGKIYGFDILSLYNLWCKCEKPLRNPYNRNLFPHDLQDKCEMIYKFSGLFFNQVNRVIAPEVNDTADVESRVLHIFQEINALGNYADHMWFLTLTRVNLIRFIREISDIWSYRADLPASVKNIICPPHGNPFIDLPMHTLPTLEIEHIRQISITIIENLILYATDTSNRSLGACYVLCALTLVSESAAHSLPWLYDSVAH